MGKALVIAGEAAQGCFQAGVLSRLEPTDYDAIYGTSSGALNAVLFSYLNFRELRGYWEGITGLTSVYQFNWLAALWRRGLFNNSPIVAKAKEIFATKTAKRPVTVSTTNTLTGAVRYWNNLSTPTDLFAEAVACSATIPGLCCSLHSEFLGDGGLRAGIPIVKAIQDGHRDITLLCSEPYENPYSTDGNYSWVWPKPLAALLNTIDIILTSDKFEPVEAAIPYLDRLIVYSPQKPLDMSYVSFNPTDIEKYIREGRYAEPFKVK